MTRKTEEWQTKVRSFFPTHTPIHMKNGLISKYDMYSKITKKAPQRNNKMHSNDSRTV